MVVPPHFHSAAELDGASIPTLLNYMDSEHPQLRADAACALGDRLRAREVQALDPPVQATLVNLLQDKNYPVRLEAAIALAELHDGAALETLLQAISLKTFRLDAMRALGTLGDKRAVQPLLQMLSRWLLPWADRMQAAAALCALEESAGATYLSSKLSSRRSAERAAAIHFLGESRHPEGRPLLTGILSNRLDPMRDVAARALGLLRDPAAREALRRALDGADAELTHDIEEALAKLPA